MANEPREFFWPARRGLAEGDKPIPSIASTKPCAWPPRLPLTRPTSIMSIENVIAAYERARHQVEAAW